VEDKFDGGMYQGDYVYDEEIMELVRWEAPAKEELRKGKGKEKEETKDDEYFAEDEKMLLDSLAVKECMCPLSLTPRTYVQWAHLDSLSFPVPNPPDPSLLPTLLFLLFSTAYETRISMADPSPESGWTLTSLLPIFTSLTSPSSYPTTTSVLLALYKRTLSFPLYRHWGLAEKVREDVADVLEGGRRSVMRSLLGMKRILDGTEAYAVYSIIWVDDALACLLAMQE
jgi:protein SHQ1